MRSSVVQSLRHHVSLATFLQGVVSNLLHGVESLLEVAALKQPLLIGLLTPDTGKTICLQLDVHGHLVRFNLAYSFARLVEPRQDAKKVLDVMADLMCENVGLRKIASSVKLLVQLSEKGRIKVNLSILWAVEWTGCRSGKTAGRLHLA